MEDNCEVDILPDRIYEQYVGATFFVSGGTGYLGKVILERLLRVFDVKKIYLLIRCKKDKPPEERLEILFTSPLFDKVRELKGKDVFTKCVIIPGDVSKTGLDLSEEDRQTLQDEVDYVIHSAATVRFDEPLRKAFLINTKGTFSMIELAKGMKNLKIFTHVSTTFCHPEEKVLYEKLYKTKHSFKQIIDLIDLCDDETVEAMSKKFLEGLPNSYTISKALAEDIAGEAMDTIPVIIVRPAIVVPIWKEPIPGWIDNMNGPMGMFVAGGKGIMRIMYGNRDAYADFMPVDVVADCIMILKVYCLHNQMPQRIYNLCAHDEVSLSWGEIIDTALMVSRTKVPFDTYIWVPSNSFVPNKFIVSIMVLLYHLLPALIVDAFLRLTGRQPFLWKLQMRIAAGQKVLDYYGSLDWNFDNRCLIHARRWLNSRELAKYTVSATNFDVVQYFVNSTLGARRYLLKEPDENISKSLRTMTFMVWFDRILSMAFKLILAYFFYKWVLLRIYNSF